MLDTNNRLNFGAVLRPFDGYEMDYALGTTYSLSLESLMFIPVTLFWGSNFNTNEQVITNEMLEALTKVPDKVKVFCQRGKIEKPAFYHEILAFWEKSIEQIQMETAYQSFHPKIWLIRYINKKDIQYKFLCTSRNLTLSKDWDLAVCMEGKVEKTTYPHNKPLYDFVEMLNQQSQKEIKKEVLDEILHINFQLNDQQKAYHFHPIGFKDYTHPLLKRETYNEKLMIISPFLDETTIREHKNNCKEFSLFSTHQELNNIPETALQGYPVYQLNPLLDMPPVAEPDETNNDHTADSNIEGDIETESYEHSCSLHAKCYITENSAHSNWYIGSANSSAPAKERNIEFLTQIDFHHKKNCIKEMQKELTEAIKGQGLFTPYMPPVDKITNDDNQKEKDLRKIIFHLSALKLNARIEENPNGKYNIILKLEEAALSLPPNWQVGILPLSALDEKESKIQPGSIPQQFIFNDFDETKLTPFLLCNVYYSELCVKRFVIELDIAFPADRMKKIFKSIICNQGRLFRYLNSLLSKEETFPLFELHKEKSKPGYAPELSASDYIALYEKLLKAASRNKSKINMVAETLSLLENETDEKGELIVSKDFADFFETFKNFGKDEI